VGAQDGRDQAWKAPLDLRAARRILHFDAAAFAADQAGLPEHLEVLIGSDFEKALVAQASLGRIGQVGDIASVAVFLASSDSGWLTGEQLLASGGLR
jgi:NAD(P)-dependent dehydrogenase (short-subunit alcohol dehydrogenase family)